MYIRKALFLVCVSFWIANFSFAQDTLKQKLNKAQSALDKVNSASKKITPPQTVRRDLKSINTQLKPIRTGMNQKQKTIPGKTLKNYAEELKKAQTRLAAYRKSLQRSGGDLKGSHLALQKLIRDSMLAVSKSDSANRPVIAAQLALLTKRLTRTDSSVSTGLDTVNKLLTDVSTAYLQVASLQDAVNNRQQPPQPSKFKQEANYLWSAPKETQQTSITKNLNNTYQGQDQVFMDFLDSTWGIVSSPSCSAACFSYGYFSTIARHAFLNKRKLSGSSNSGTSRLYQFLEQLS